MRSGSEIRRRSRLLPPVRCTEDELAAVGATARNANKTVSQFVRESVLGKASPGPKPRRRRQAADVQQLARILGQLGKYGSNLNQLARASNEGEPVRRQEFEQLATQIREVSSAVLEALDRGN